MVLLLLVLLEPSFNSFVSKMRINRSYVCSKRIHKCYSCIFATVPFFVIKRFTQAMDGSVLLFSYWSIFAFRSFNFERIESIRRIALFNICVFYKAYIYKISTGYKTGWSVCVCHWKQGALLNVTRPLSIETRRMSCAHTKHICTNTMNNVCHPIVRSRTTHIKDHISMS